LNEILDIDESVEISLKYWKSKADFNAWELSQNSGAYIFQSEYGQYDALPYSSLV
jgi:heme-degrading monooxygenase HmoA